MLIVAQMRLCILFLAWVPCISCHVECTATTAWHNSNIRCFLPWLSSCVASACRRPSHPWDHCKSTVLWFCYRRDPDAWTYADGRPYFTVSAPVAADPELRDLLVSAAAEQVGPDAVVQGLNATADSFYSSQGRTGCHFEDENDKLIEQLLDNNKQLMSLEMETFHLLDLARCSKGTIKAAAFHIAAAERYSNR